MKLRSPLSSVGWGINRTNLFFVFAGLFVFSLAFRLVGLNRCTLSGDEFHTVEEIKYFGLNIHSLLYFLFMKVWTFFGTSEIWLRFASVLFGAFACCLIYMLGSLLINARMGFLLGLLLATSPLALYHSQSLRFYSFFLMNSTFAWLAFAYFYFQRSLRAGLLWGVADIFCILSHGFGIFLVAIQFLVLFFLSKRRRLWKIIICGLGVFILLVFAYVFREKAHDMLQHYAHAVTVHGYIESRGFGIVNLGKLAITIYQFVLGNSVYPMLWFLVIPAFSIHAVLLFIAIQRMKENRLLKAIMGVSFFTLIFIVLGLDSFAPKTTGVQFRYLLFLLPVYYLALCFGVSRFSGRWALVFSTALILINLGASFCYFKGDWSFSGKRVSWHDMEVFLENETTDLPVFYGGRAEPYFRYYFSDFQNMHSAWDLLNIEKQEEDLSRILLVFFDFRKEMHQELNNILRNVENEYTLKRKIVRPPLTALIYEKNNDSAPPSIQKPLPQELLGMEFMDLDFPFNLSVQGQEIEILGPLTITDELIKKVHYQNDFSTKHLTLLSNLTGSVSIPDGVMIGRIRIISKEGRLDLPIVKGEETHSWMEEDLLRKGKTAEPVFSWRKRIHMAGKRAYSGSWRDFEAKIYSYEYGLEDEVKIESIEFEVFEPGVELRVWGIL
ncbi:MAG: glycosyltransferase family 39 protein [Candidatus Omnitrophica bacterium]|nr:glycosyltransferase family 39 protein [Candidatus Omnitrophota bacterium]